VDIGILGAVWFPTWESCLGQESLDFSAGLPVFDFKHLIYPQLLRCSIQIRTFEV